MTDIFVLLTIVALFALIFAGIPIGYALLAVTFVGLTMSIGFDPAASLLWNTIYSQSQDYVVSTIPMFILMALVLNNSGILSDVFDMMDKWTRGVLPGGIAIGTTMANGVFAALSGSSAAAAAAIAKVAKPELDKKGYRDTLAMGTVAASGTFAMMFPPSIAFIIYGIITETNIGHLFIAGIIPGIMTVVAYVGLILVWVKYNPSMAGGNVSDEPYSWGERIRATGPIFPAALLVILVLGGIYAGVVTPTEAGALGATGALLIAVGLYGLKFGEFNDALHDTASITAYIFVLIIGAKYFGRYVALEGIVNDLLDLLLALPFEGLGLVVLILAFYLLLGMFLDQLPILVLTLPVTFPIFVETLGYDPLWFGIIVIKTVEIGMITPPIGINAYIASNAVDVDASVTFRGATRFIVADLVVLGTLIAFPGLVTYLPEMMG